MKTYYNDIEDLINWIRKRHPPIQYIISDEIEIENYKNLENNILKIYQNKNKDIKEIQWREYLSKNRGFYTTKADGFYLEEKQKWDILDYPYYYMNGHKFQIIEWKYSREWIFSINKKLKNILLVKFNFENKNIEIPYIYLGVIYSFNNGLEKEYRITFMDEPSKQEENSINEWFLKIKKEELNNIYKLFNKPNSVQHWSLMKYHLNDLVNSYKILLIQRWYKTAIINYRRKYCIQKAYIVKSWFENPDNPVSNKLRENWFKKGIILDILN